VIGSSVPGCVHGIRVHHPRGHGGLSLCVSHGHSDCHAMQDTSESRPSSTAMAIYRNVKTLTNDTQDHVCNRDRATDKAEQKQNKASRSTETLSSSARSPATQGVDTTDRSSVGSLAQVGAARCRNDNYSTRRSVSPMCSVRLPHNVYTDLREQRGHALMRHSKSYSCMVEEQVHASG
jgi:hypothetical protein